MRELPFNPENNERKNCIIQLGKDYANLYLFITINQNSGSTLNKIGPQTTNPKIAKPYLFVDSSEKIEADPEILKEALNQAQEEIGEFSEKEKVLFKKAYKHRLFMGTPLNEV